MYHHTEAQPVVRLAGVRLLPETGWEQRLCGFSAGFPLFPSDSSVNMGAVIARLAGTAVIWAWGRGPEPGLPRAPD